MDNLYDIPQFLEKEITIVTLDKEMPNVNNETVFYSVEESQQPQTPFAMSLKGFVENLNRGDIISFSEVLTEPKIRIKELSQSIVNGLNYTNIIYEDIENDDNILEVVSGSPVYKVSQTTTSTNEALKGSSTNEYDELLLSMHNHTVPDHKVFDELKDTLPFAFEDSKLKFFAKYPGAWANDIEIAIANIEDFGEGKYIKEGLPLDNQFDYLPYNNQFVIIVLYQNEIVEKYICSFDPLEKNDMNTFIFAETLINQKSDYILVNVNESISENKVKSYLGDDVLRMKYGADSPAGQDDIIEAYSIFDNKEEMDVDVIIANEKYPQAAANIAMTRQDCIAYIGAPKETSVGLKNVAANTNTINFRKTLNIDSKYVTLTNNYKYQYCKELGGYRWVNLVGDIAGLKARTNSENGSWYAAAGLNRGLIKNCVSLAYAPTSAQRDDLYKSGVNPVVMFPDTGAALWGQKTLQTKESSFDRVNVVSLFNYMERALARMSKYSLFEFNDAFTRNYILSLIRPFLTDIKTGRGIADFMVVCDTSNNTPQVIAENKLVIDIFVKPNYVAEFIHIRFTNVGTNDFSIATGTVS